MDKKILLKQRKKIDMQDKNIKGCYVMVIAFNYLYGNINKKAMKIL